MSKINDETKTCNKCGETKSVLEFDKRGTGYSYKCKSCRRKDVAEYDKKNREKRGDYFAWRMSNTFAGRTEIARACQARDKGISAEDDLTTQDVIDLWNEQEQKCPHCGKVFVEISDFHIAHNISKFNNGHLTKSNIQLLCPECNSKQGTKNIFYITANANGTLSELSSCDDNFISIIQYSPVQTGIEQPNS